VGVNRCPTMRSGPRGCPQPRAQGARQASPSYGKAMSRYSVTLARNETNNYLAWVHELPGCFAEEPITFDIVEVAGAAAQTAEGSTGVLPTWDQKSLTPDDWAPIERWLHHSRMEVLRTLESLNGLRGREVSGARP